METKKTIAPQKGGDSSSINETSSATKPESHNLIVWQGNCLFQFSKGYWTAIAFWNGRRIIELVGGDANEPLENQSNLSRQL